MLRRRGDVAGRLAGAARSRSSSARARRTDVSGRQASPSSMRWRRSPSRSGHEAARQAIHIEPGRQLAASHALLEQELGRADQPLAAADEHLADAGSSIGLGPGRGRGRPGPAPPPTRRSSRRNRPTGGGQPGRGRASGAPAAIAELLEALPGQRSQLREEEVVLAREVRVDRPDRQAGPSTTSAMVAPVEALARRRHRAAARRIRSRTSLLVFGLRPGARDLTPVRTAVLSP